MHSLSRVLCAAGFAIWIPLAGCKTSEDARATREDCQKVSEHVADIVVDTAKADPAVFWDLLHESTPPDDIPATVTKASFPGWLATPEGQTFLMKRRGQTLAGTQQAVDACIANASKKDVRCFLAAKSGSDVEACDKARAPKAASGSDAGTGSASSEPAGSGSSTGSGSSAGSASAASSGSSAM